MNSKDPISKKGFKDIRLITINYSYENYLRSIENEVFGVKNEGAPRIIRRLDENDLNFVLIRQIKTPQVF